jgi:hypothetical protein
MCGIQQFNRISRHQDSIAIVSKQSIATLLSDRGATLRLDREAALGIT